MSFGSVIKKIFGAIIEPFKAFFDSAAGKQYEASAKALLSTAEGQVALAVVQKLASLTIGGTAARTLALAQIAALLTAEGFELAESEIALLIETAVNYIKGKFGTQSVAVDAKVVAAVASTSTPVVTA